MKISIIKKNKNKSKIIYNILGILFIFLIWFILSYYFNNSLVIPKIKDVFKTLIKILSTSRIYKLLLLMIIRIILTVVISFIISLLMAIFAIKNKNIYNFLNPLIVVMKTMPIIAIIILLLLSVGMNLSPYIATALVIIPIIYESLYTSFTQIDTNVTDDIKTVSNINFKIIIKFYIPLILSNVITTIIQSVGLGLKVMIMAEYLSSKNNTIGFEINRYYVNLDMEAVYALLLIVIIIVFCIDLILKKIREKKENEN